MFLHLDLVDKKPTTPKYDFTRKVQGHRGTIFSSEGTALAKTTNLWEYRVDPVVAARDPIHPDKPADSAKRMENIKTVAELLGLPLAKVMDAYAVQNSRFVALAVSDDTAAHSELANPKRGFRELSITEKQARLYPQGRRVGVGIFGMVIPTVNFSDILLSVGPVHKGYGKGLIKNTYIQEEYFGDNPNVKEYHFKGDETE